MAAKRDKLSKTACRGFKSFCPCHRHGSLQTPKIRRLRAFSMPKLSDWTRSKDTGFPWQNPPNAPIFVNIPTTAVWYIIKKASANFRKRTVLYRVPRRGLTEKRNAFFLFNLVVLIKTDVCLTVVSRCDKIKVALVLVWRINRNL